MKIWIDIKNSHEPLFFKSVNSNFPDFQYYFTCRDFAEITDLLENYKSILKVMRPVIPHMTSECLDELNIKNQDEWPKVNKEYTSNNQVNIVIQINGKKRSIINIQKDLDEKTLIIAIKKDLNIKKFLENNIIIRSIYVKNKLINLIVK